MPRFLRDKFKVWQLGDYCAWIGKDPSVHLHLREMGIPETVCNDFDYAVRALMRFWDGRAEEMIEVVDTSPQRKGKRMKPERKYKSLFQILGLNKDGSEPERDGDTVKASQDLAATMASGTTNWAEYGYS